MTYSENLTNRELMFKAMPLSSLTGKQWNALLKHIEEVERSEGNETVLYKALETMHNNQARLEVMSNYFDYYHDVLDDPVKDKASEVFQIGA